MALLRSRVASWSLVNRLLHPPSPVAYRNLSTVAGDFNNPTVIENMKRELLNLDINSQIGSCMPIASMRIGTIIHNIEVNPGQGGKLVRAAGTSAKILKDPTKSRQCLIRLPSGVEKLIDSRCRATVGTVSNPSHGAKKLRNAGHSRWMGRRPVVRGVAMNPIDHPHGGGEGKSKSSGSYGKTSRTPWGKPCKCGYKTAASKRRKK
ncbi:Ribosomal protein L2 [Corchorus capsularis]|uniref:Ribosomal protein L2 n=1 Tax=Corchorus capsularis TaxID=210143 RepID=A0A1R3GW17_COCAP|nr:Ribosomal protein L2 [Corchorus capsularis]